MKQTIEFNVLAHLGFGLGNNLSRERGLPVSCTILAESLSEAEDIAKRNLKKMTSNLFGNVGVSAMNHEICELNTPFHFLSSIAILSLEVTPTYMMDNDCYRADVRDMFNNIWSHVDYRDGIQAIMQPYFERDKEEMANRYCDECIWWELSKLSFDDACERIDFEDILYEWINHTADEADILCIIDYLRPRDLYPNNEWYDLM